MGWEVRPCPSWLRTSCVGMAAKNIAGDVISSPSLSVPTLLFAFVGVGSTP